MGVGAAPKTYAGHVSGARAIALAPAREAQIEARLEAPRAGVRYASIRKRLFDLALACAALIGLSPLLALIWLAIRVTSEGPGLHWSQRVGRGGVVFMMPKFRTMRASAPQVAREVLTDAEALITPIGKILRRTSLDELPQLLSVITGDMSLIGPRPLLPGDPAQTARTDFPEALELRPGMSGLAQVRGRNLVSPRRKARLDAFYARARSGWFDLQIVARTLFVLISGRGFL